ncbi:alpha/beta hydrolase [Cellulomonas sp. zg-ZUI199]|uniref:Alpha/beta hydrolase n=1 Tax=Cellulomonas wangleii TaxID=2816956 RepID=A0ABX8D5S0_9CELL|nr:alpha/beta hydrolase [Cellulomonas wangleii]MBO0923010.1 alpha/beta hydrolase [Cellulomonas wangleii]QVI61397.1 alpha/beta hydrolase [Cellulomonas wangleii]
MTSGGDAADPAPGWRPDVLGAGYEQHTLPLPPDDAGPVVATLVRHVPAADDPDLGLDVLYVHGWSDYFFQTELADFWGTQGARFFALDLRRYGRSLRPGQIPGFVTDLATYDEDVAAARAVMAQDVPADRPRRLVLMGHSTGGLTLSLWAARHPGEAAALVLNSPWLELQIREVGRALLEPVLQVDARLRPAHRLPVVDRGYYTRVVSDAYGGEWHYDLTWRPERGFRVTSGWLAAILAGQDRLARGLDLAAPALVLLSTRSALLPRWDPSMTRADVALDVDGVARRAADLGRHVTIARIEDALHDVVLSPPAVRREAYATTARWVAGTVTLTDAAAAAGRAPRPHGPAPSRPRLHVRGPDRRRRR